MVRMRSGSATRKQLLARSRILILAALCCMIGQGSALAKKQLPAKPIDINAATVKELEELPGVGPTTAKAIVLFRMRSGRFRRVDDLLAIRGISEAKLRNMRRYVTLGPPPATPQPNAASKKSP
jgi:competence ComEA-like helix-hairpin-helix protein